MMGTGKNQLNCMSLYGGGVNRFSDRRIPLKKLFGFWIWRIFYTDLLICGSY
jgi:hypothetical protein